MHHTKSDTGTKPPKGSKLNKPANVTFVNMFPNTGPKAIEKEKNKYYNC